MPAPLNPRDAVPLLLPLLQSAFGECLRCVILKGSALKGDFIPYYSDLDLHAFLSADALLDGRAPRRELALALQAGLGRLRPSDYGCNSFQVSFLDWSSYPDDWARPLPGTYTVVHGVLPPGFTEVSAADYLPHCRAALQRLPGVTSSLLGRIADKPDSGLPPLLRLAGTELKAALYCALTLRTGDPDRAWRLPLGAALDELAPYLAAGEALRAYFRAVRDWPTLVTDAGRVREALGWALECLEELGSPSCGARQSDGERHTGAAPGRVGGPQAPEP